MAIVSGGIQQGSVWMGNTEAKIQMDLEKLLGWKEATAYIHSHSQLGDKFNRDYVGSFIGVDNIENGANTGQFDHAWIQKSFFDNRLSVLAGLYAVDYEFYVTDTSGLFIQPPYGPGNELSQSGQSGPPIFPLGALGIRAKYTSPNQHYYLQGALTDGLPGDSDNPYGTHIKLGNSDGTFTIAEFGYTPPKVESLSESGSQSGSAETGIEADEESEFFNKTAIGFWHYSSPLDDLIDVDAIGNPLRHPSQGAYFLAERTLMTENESPSQGLAGFIRFGVASGDVHQSDWTGSLGLRYHGLFFGRDDDVAGVAITLNHASDKYRRLNNAEDIQASLEGTYRAQFNPWLALLPTLQYIYNPNMDPELRNTWIFGTRAEITF